MAVAFGAVGTGGSSSPSGTGGTASTSGTHTPAAGDNLVIISVGICLNTTALSTLGASFVVTYGGVAATACGAAGLLSASTTLKLQMQDFYFLNPPAGASTINASVTYTSSASAANSGIFVESTSYSGADVPTSRVIAGTTTGASNSVVAGTVPTGSMGRFTHLTGGSSSANITAYNQTQRQKLGPTGRSLMLVGDAAGAGASITSTATQFSTNWVAQSYIIPPGAVTNTGNFFAMF